MYANLLVPVSLEEERTGRRALDIARTLASDGAEITVLHALEPVPFYAEPLVSDDQRARAKANVASALDRLAAQAPGASVEVVPGHAARTILDRAHHLFTDCILIGPHRPGMQHLLLGSTAGRVVRHARCAVHVVR